MSSHSGATSLIPASDCARPFNLGSNREELAQATLVTSPVDVVHRFERVRVELGIAVGNILVEIHAQFAGAIVESDVGDRQQISPSRKHPTRVDDDVARLLGLIDDEAVEGAEIFAVAIPDLKLARFRQAVEIEPLRGNIPKARRSGRVHVRLRSGIVVQVRFGDSCKPPVRASFVVERLLQQPRFVVRFSRRAYVRAQP